MTGIEVWEESPETGHSPTMMNRIRKTLSTDEGYAWPGWLTVLVAILVILAILWLVGVKVNVG